MNWNANVTARGAWLGGMALLGTVIVAAIWIWADRFTDPDGIFGENHCRTIWEVWELGAVLWSLGFSLYYLYDYKMVGEQGLDKAVIVLMVFASAAIPAATIWYLLWDYRPLVPIALVLVLNLVYFAVDYFLSVTHSDAEKQRCHKESFWLADIPIVIANALFFEWLLRNLHRPDWIAFAGGLVAFQLITCNCIFVVTQSGINRHVWSRTEQPTAPTRTVVNEAESTAAPKAVSS
jgi:hypothetical protein